MLSSIGLPGVLLLIILALLLFGPNKLPELGRAIGRTFREFKEGAATMVNTDPADATKTDATSPIAQPAPAVAAVPSKEDANKRLPE